MNLTGRLLERFRRFPFWTQTVITLGSVGILVALWSACGGPAPRVAPPLSSPRLELSGDFGTIFSLAFSPTSGWLAVGTGDTQIHAFDVSTNQVLRAMSGHIKIVKALAFSPDGKILASASMDKTIKLWDTSTGSEIRTLSEHTAGVSGVAFSPDGRTLASSSYDATIILWDVSSGNLLQKLTGHTDHVNSVAFRPDGRIVASASDDGSVRLWDPQTGILIRSLPEANARVESVAFSPDGTYLAWGASRNFNSRARHYGALRIWNLETMSLESGFRSYRGDVRMVAFRPDGAALAVAEWPWDSKLDSFITLRNVKNQGVLERYDVERGGELYAIAYSKDGRWLASGGRSGRIHLW